VAVPISSGPQKVVTHTLVFHVVSVDLACYCVTHKVTEADRSGPEFHGVLKGLSVIYREASRIDMSAAFLDIHINFHVFFSGKPL
jgi:hypothetical protein